LKDSGAELLLGDFSGNGNKQVPMGGNSSSSKLQKRQGPFLVAGTGINLRRQDAHLLIRTCTLGFAVRKRSGRGQFNQGYLTAGSCSSTRGMVGLDTAFVVGNNAEETIVATRAQTKGSYDPAKGLNYAVLKVRHNY
jgi:hypothetical protein